MNKGNLNKLVTNYPVELTEEEIENLSGTLAPVIAACGGGGGTGGKIYTGIGFVSVNNTTNQIGLTNEANTKLNQDIPTKVSDLTDSASYQTVAGMDEYLTEVEAQATYLTKSSADTLYAPLSTTADVEALKAASGDFSQYYKKNETYNKTEVYSKTETSSKETLSAEFDKYQTKENMVNYTTKQEVDDIQSNLLVTISSKQSKLTFGYDENSAISSINDSALAGQGGKTYTPGQYIDITNNTISVTGVLALDEYAQYEPVLIGDANITATSSKVDSHTQWNLAINSTPVVTDTKIVGENCVTAHTTTVSGEWAVGLVQTAYEAINSIAGITTDVGTLKTASASWNEVSAKLDSSVASTTYQTKSDMANYLTTSDAASTYQQIGNYASASDINDMATKTWVGQQGYLTAVPDTYATKTDLNTASSTLTGVDNALSGHIDYVSSHAITSLDNYYTKTQVDSTFASATQLNDYLTTAQYNTDSAKFLTAHQSLTNYYQKSETSGATELSTEFAKYVTSSNVTTQNTDYVMTTTGWKVLTLPGGMTQVIHDTTLTGQGNADNSKLGVVWSALSGNTIYSALSAGSATSALSATDALSSRYSKQLQDASKIIQINDITALQNWASSNSSTWDSVTAKLTTAQYATDSATFVTSSSNTITGTKQYALTTAGWSDIGLSNYLPLSGGTVSGEVIVKSTGKNLLAVNTDATLMGQSRVANLTDTTAIGTNWMGVNSYGGGFIKNVQGGNVGDLNGTSIQINFAPDGANSYGNITVNSQNNESKIINVPTASYNSMSSFDNTNGPNYMLRKTASGFDIGAAVINVTSLPSTTEANAYYFVYDT